jgi:hypothetical protein
MPGGGSKSVAFGEFAYAYAYDANEIDLQDHSRVCCAP